MKLKSLLLLILLPLSLSVSAGEEFSAVFNKLKEINRYWQHYPQAAPANFVPVTDQRAMIKMHLQLVEQHLRTVNVHHLSEKQQKARINNLNNLRAYWQSEAFPINTTHAYRLPIFIDPFDNFCAVGYLIKASGNEALSRYISRNSNFAYLAEMNYPELNTWASASGLSFQELAWIQPGYPPSNTISSMGGGTNGTVKAITSDDTGIIYAAGQFSEAGGQPGANSVAMWISGIAGYSWVQMGPGLVGSIEALQFHNNELYAVGHDILPTGVVNSIAKWNGSIWENITPSGGFLKAMAVYNNELYVGGEQGTPGNSAILAKWDGATWTDLNLPVAGAIHSLHVHNGKLIIGGEFTSSAAPESPNILEFDGSQLSGIGFGVPAKVRALATFKNKLFAGGDYLNAQGDTFGLASFNGTSWKNLVNRYGADYLSPASPGAECFVSALAPLDTNSLILGGSFFTNVAGIGNFGQNFSAYHEFISGGEQFWIFSGSGMLDQPVYALHVDDTFLYLGGAFTQNLNSPLPSVGYTSIVQQPGSAPEANKSVKLTLYPNPATSYAKIKGSFAEGSNVNFTIYNLLGQQVRQWQDSGAAEGNFTFSRGQLSRGTYILQATQAGSMVGTAKFVVE